LTGSFSGADHVQSVADLHRLELPPVIQFLVSTLAIVAPSQLVRSVKGRLQHVRRHEIPRGFRRNYRLESIGSAKREVVERYVAEQLGHHPMADRRAQEKLAGCQIDCPGIDLAQVRYTAHGQYVYNLHLVLVHTDRWREFREDALRKTHDTVRRICDKKGYLLSKAGILPDHLHVTAGYDVERSPPGRRSEFSQ
jgi:REP element-mobilizing transposase RayT